MRMMVMPMNCRSMMMTHRRAIPSSSRRRICAHQSASGQKTNCHYFRFHGLFLSLEFMFYIYTRKNKKPFLTINF
jgi:hypothetical protein